MRRTPRSTLAGLPAALLLACSPPTDCPPGSSLNEADGLCYLDDTGEPGDVGGGSGGSGDEGGSGSGDEGGSGSGDEGGDTGGGAGGLPDSFTEGDPIATLETTAGVTGAGIVEWMDAAFIDDERVLVTGQGGWAVLDVDTNEIVISQAEGRGYKVDVHGDWAVIGRRDSGLQVLDVSVPDEAKEGARFMPIPEFNEDVSIYDDLIAVGYQAEGVLLLDLHLQTVGEIAASSSAYAVALSEDRLAWSDGEELVLTDVSDPENPSELDRVETSGAGRDLDWEDGRIALAMGGAGAAVYTVEDDAFVLQGEVSTPGSAFSVGLDGDYLWIGAWETTALAWVGEGGPIVIGHEDPRYSAMGLDAHNGLAMVADWYNQTLLQREDLVAGPELQAEAKITATAGDPQTYLATFRNHGAMDLELSIEAPSGGWTWEAEDVTVAPGDWHTVAVTSPASGTMSARLRWTSNDADESSGFVELTEADGSVGTEHPDILLETFTWPDTTVSLSDWSAETNDSVVLLAYFALY